MKRWTFATIAVLFILLPMREALRADQVQYTVEDLGTIDGLVPTVTGINASGQVSGYVTLGPDTNTRAVRYTNGLGWSYLSGLESVVSAANGINAYGDVTGTITDSGMQFAFRYTDTGGPEVIFPFAGGTFISGSAINASGVVVGFGDFAGTLQAFRAAPGMGAELVPSFGGSFSMACGINDAGQIVGQATTPDGAQHAVRYELDGTVVDAGTFEAVGSSGGCAIDGDGRLGGQSTLGGISRAFRFSTGGLLNLDNFGSSFSTVESIAAGTSVGWYLSADGSASRAFIHTDASGSRDLNSLIAPDAGWVLTLAKAVSSEGQIVGAGTLNGAPRAFRLTLQVAADTKAPVIDSLAASPSLITTPNGAMVPVTVQVNATDDVDAAPSCTITSIASAGSAAGDFEFTAGELTARVRAVPGRIYTMSVACSDAAGNTSPASTITVGVADDTTAPVIGLLVATPSRIWPPNGRMVDVQLTVGATDDVDPSPSCALTSVRGTDTGDARITGPLSAQVRARKNDDGSDRTYLLTVTCADDSGNRARRSVRVLVAKGDGDSDYYAMAYKAFKTFTGRGHDKASHDRDRDGDDDHDRSGKGRR